LGPVLEAGGLGSQRLWVDLRLQFPPDKTDEPKCEGDDEDSKAGEDLLRGHGGGCGQL